MHLSTPCDVAELEDQSVMDSHDDLPMGRNSYVYIDRWTDNLVDGKFKVNGVATLCFAGIEVSGHRQVQPHQQAVRDQPLEQLLARFTVDIAQQKNAEGVWQSGHLQSHRQVFLKVLRAQVGRQGRHKLVHVVQRQWVRI